MNSYDNIQLRLRLLTREIDETLLNYNCEGFSGMGSALDLETRNYSEQHRLTKVRSSEQVQDQISSTPTNIEFQREIERLRFELKKKSDVESQRVKVMDRSVRQLVINDDNDRFIDGSRIALGSYGLPASYPATPTGTSDALSHGADSYEPSVERAPPSLSPPTVEERPFTPVTPQLVDEQLRLSLRRERMEEERSLAHLRMEREKLEKEIDAAVRERSEVAKSQSQILSAYHVEQGYSKPQARTLSPPRASIDVTKIASPIPLLPSVQRFSVPSSLTINTPQAPPRLLLCDVPVMIVPTEEGPMVSSKLLLYKPQTGEGTDCVVIPSSPNILPLSLIDEKVSIRLLLPFATLGWYSLGGRIVTGASARAQIITQGCTGFAARERNRHLRVYCLWRDEETGGDLMCIWQFLSISHWARVVSIVGGGGRPHTLRTGRVLWWAATSLLRQSKKGADFIADARRIHQSLRLSNRAVDYEKQNSQHKRSPSLRKLKKVILYPPTSKPHSLVPSPSSHRDIALPVSTAPPTPINELHQNGSTRTRSRGPPQHLRRPSSTPRSHTPLSHMPRPVSSSQPSFPVRY